MMILGDFFVPLTALIFLRLLWSDCVWFFLDSVFFLCFLLVMLFFFFFLFFLLLTLSFAKDSSVMMLSDLLDLLSLSSSSVVEKTSKQLLQFILDVSVWFPCFRGPFLVLF